MSCYFVLTLDVLCNTFNLRLKQTSNIYLSDFIVPSGGDWSVHRGGTIYLRNTKNVTITHNLLTQLGSNGVAVND
jgi:hypothetical protein